MPTFKYKWKLRDSEFIGTREAADEHALRQHITQNGGQLIEILEKTEKAREHDSGYNSSSDSFDMKKCPFCGEKIRAEAIKCKHCGEMLNKDKRYESPPPGAGYPDPCKPSRGSNNMLAIASFVLGILAVVTGITGVGILFAIIAVCIGPSGKDSEHRVLASWGISLGWFVIVCYIVVILFWGLFFGGLAFLARLSGAR